MAAGYATKSYVARSWLLLTVVCTIATVMAYREVVRRAFMRLRRSGRLIRPVLVVGANGEGVNLAEALAHDPSLGYHIVGFVDDDAALSQSVGAQGWQVVGRVADAPAVAMATGATGVIIATTAVGWEVSNRLARQ